MYTLTEPSLIIFGIFAMLLIFFSVRSMLGGIAYLRFFRSSLEPSRGDFTPMTTIIAPCRGLDAGLYENLSRLFEQDYPLYEIVFAVDDPADPAARVIRSLIDANKRLPAKLVIADKATHASQKIANQIEAIKHASPESTCFVFVDSDARPSCHWLRALVGPLVRKKNGAATGYRWFIAQSPGMATELRSAWNASIASALGPDSTSNFCWGGSMAIRRDVFDELRIANEWANALSDDLALTRTLKQAGMNIEFVPAALVPSIENCTFAEMIEFTTRQMKVTRTYTPDLWVLSGIGSGLFCSVMLAATVMLIGNEPQSFAFIFALLTIAIVSACSTLKAWLRLNAVKLVLRENRSDLERQAKWQLTLWLITPFVFFYNVIAAAISRRIKWRGTTYELKSRSETVIISD